MHNNYYFLVHLVRALRPRLTGAVMSECFSQSKDELILRFETKGDPFFIKADLQAQFTCISFPDNFQRARKNSVDLFGELIGRRVSDVIQFENERCFCLVFEENFRLLFKMHGNRSNLVLFENTDPMVLFRNNIVADTTIDIASLDRPMDWSYESFLRNHEKLRATYFTLGKIPWRYLDERGFNLLPPDEQWKMFQEMLEELRQPDFYLTRDENELVFSLLPIGDIQKESDDPLKAVTAFYYTYTQQHALLRERQSALSSLREKLKSAGAYLEKTARRRKETTEDTNFKLWADLIMANLHAITPGTERVLLQDFYKDNHQVEIKLKRDLTPQKNAEIFYRKSKNQQLETERLTAQINTAQAEIGLLEERIAMLEAAPDLKSVRMLRTSFGIGEEKERAQEILPYREVEYRGFRILIGKNAQANDTLTLRYGYKEDLWLHAKDVSGSHVLIKFQSGKIFPKDVIEKAGQLAAYHSKRRNESLCPVAVTQKKYVRKRKGDPAGAVVVEREEVIMVVPAKE